MKRILAILIALYLFVFLVGGMSAFADAGPYVFDEADLLSDTEEADLAALAMDITEEYPINVYVAAVNDFYDLGASNA